MILTRMVGEHILTTIIARRRHCGRGTAAAALQGRARRGRARPSPGLAGPGPAEAPRAQAA